ncbi:serine/threonine-protein kinase [Nonomuraea sp. NPDC049158]|uniref:serine/threonine-protein kinase n=1 Tax=Nonomuraea sp. NPDC049158 TaxID=3155649 RepID=UPI0033DCEFAB
MTIVASRYRLLAPLGQGGMGTVWRAVDELLRQEVAVKEVRLPPELDHAARAELTERTLREARAAARLRSHPSIVTVHDVVMDGGRPWIVMELIHGRSLDQIVRTDGPLSPRQTAWVGRHVLDALGAAHAMGVLHRDVKPGNVLLTDDGRVLLTDFGIATVAGDAALTQTGLLTGSPGYIAPERLRGEDDGPAADLWSLGATLYTAVEGSPGFSGPNAAAVMAAVLLRDPAPARLAGPLAPLLAALLEKDPQRRCTAEQAAHRLHDIAQGDTPTTIPAHREPPVKRRRTLVVAGALALAVCGTAATAIWLNLPPATPNANADPSPKSPKSAKSAKPSPTKSVVKLFGRVPDACKLLTNVRARTLLGGTARRQVLSTSQCQWQGAGNASVMVTTYRTPTVKSCGLNLDGMVTRGKDERARHPDTKLRSARVVGDRTAAYTRRDPDVAAGFHNTQVSFCLANLLAYVNYVGPRPGYGTADQAAKHVAAALKARR